MYRLSSRLVSSRIRRISRCVLTSRLVMPMFRSRQTTFFLYLFIYLLFNSDNKVHIYELQYKESAVVKKKFFLNITEMNLPEGVFVAGPYDVEKNLAAVIVGIKPSRPVAESPEAVHHLFNPIVWHHQLDCRPTVSR